jgi:L-alanine-DL-glutamate epimerase-like enolase superfamily enzyme
MTAEGRALTIAKVDAIPVDLPLHTPINLGGRLKLSVAEVVIVRIETADGTVGWGECASGPLMTGDLIDGMVVAIRQFIAPALIGHDAQPLDDALVRAGRAIRGNMAAKSAVDMALHDLVGQALGVPAYVLLGGAKRSRAAAMWMLGNPTVEADVAEAEARRREGYHVFKLKVGTKDIEADIRCARTVRAAIGRNATLTVDANTTWSEAKATQFAEATRDLNIVNIEQPLPDDDLDGMARIAAATGLPICADEGIYGIADLEAHAQRFAAQGVSLKPLKFGGLAAVRRAAERCVVLGLKVNLAEKVAVSSLATAGLLHLAASVPAVDWNVTATNHYLADDIVPSRLTPRDGWFDVPQLPGLGVTVDPAQVERYRRR